MDGSPAVIDLGSGWDGHPADTSVPRPLVMRRIRIAALALAMALVVATGGSAAPVPPPLEEILTASLGLDENYLLTEDLLFVSTPASDPPERLVTAYELGRGRPLWTSRHRIAPRRLGLWHANGLLLITDYDPEAGPLRTVALDTRTGQRRWSVPYMLDVPPGEGTALVVDEVYPANSIEAGQATPTEIAGQSFYVSSSGGVYTAPPVGAVARAVDLDSGRVLWSSPLLTNVGLVEASAGGTSGVLVVTRDGRVEVWDLRTGAVWHRLAWTEGTALSAESAGGLLLVRHTGPGLTAYSADLRQRRWSRPLPDEDTYLGRCGQMLCQEGPAGNQVVDPGTGATAWQAPDQTSLFPSGGHLVEADEQINANRTVDPRTGRTLIDLAGWRRSTIPEQVGPLLLVRDNPIHGRTLLGILEPDARAVRTLGAVPYVASSCRGVVGRIACRTGPNELRVWRYR